jgi:carbamoyl-phosphate synthase large subunit
VSVNVLLTGAGGNLAYFIRKALLCSGLDLRIVACDHSHNAVGLYQAEVGYVVPAAEDPTYTAKVLEICRRERIHIILIGGMAEMRVLAQNRDRIREAAGAFVVTSPPDVLRRMEDKWELTRYLARAGFDFPRSILPGGDTAALEKFLDETPFPYVVKDRFGAGSQNVVVARNKKQLTYQVEAIPNPVIQEYLYPEDEEYTVGVFVCADGTPSASIVMKRQLGLGMTMKAQVLADSDLGPYCERMLANSGCVGPCNVQLRRTARGPVAFEVNPRFSSTTSARTHYGYNDAAMCIRHFVLKQEIERPAIRGGRFFRVIEEVFVDEETFDLLKKEGRIQNETVPPAAVSRPGDDGPLPLRGPDLALP